MEKVTFLSIQCWYFLKGKEYSRYRKIFYATRVGLTFYRLFLRMCCRHTFFLASKYCQVINCWKIPCRVLRLSLLWHIGKDINFPDLIYVDCIFFNHTNVCDIWDGINDNYFVGCNSNVKYLYSCCKVVTKSSYKIINWIYLSSISFYRNLFQFTLYTHLLKYLLRFV